MLKGDDLNSSSIEEKNVSSPQVLALFYCAKQYDVPPIYKACRQYMIEEPTMQNALLIFENIRGTDEELLEKVALAFIKK